MTKPSFLNSETLIPLGTVASLIFTVVAIMFWINVQLSEINKSLASIEHKLDMSVQLLTIKMDNLEDKVAVLDKNQWSHGDQCLWAAQLKIANKDIKIPTDILPDPSIKK